MDDHLGEQLLRDASYREEHAIVARRIERTLRPHAIWVAAAPEPELVRIANIQHLATPIRAQLAAPMEALELAGLMHPTPAVGGEPLERAAPLIPALEGLDRGWYAGPVGWTDATGDGEFCVALRCALLRGGVARCYAGNGIVRGSDPAARAGRDRGQAAGAAAAAHGLRAPATDGLPHAPVQSDVRRALATHFDDRSSPRRRARARAPREVAHVRDTSRGRGRRAPRPGEVQAGRRGDVLV